MSAVMCVLIAMTAVTGLHLWTTRGNPRPLCGNEPISRTELGWSSENVLDVAAEDVAFVNVPAAVPGYSGMALPGVVVRVNGSDTDMELVVHEMAHVDQYRRLGRFQFAKIYVTSYLRGRWNGCDHWEAYRAIPLEWDAELRASACRPRWTDATETVAKVAPSCPAPEQVFAGCTDAATESYCLAEPSRDLEALVRLEKALAELCGPKCTPADLEHREVHDDADDRPTDHHSASN